MPVTPGNDKKPPSLDLAKDESLINFRGTTFIDEGSSDFILITGVSVLQGRPLRGRIQNDLRGKFSQPSGIYSLHTNIRPFLLVPSARFTICHLEYHAEAGFAKSSGRIFFCWGRERISWLSFRGTGKVFIISYQEVD